MSITTVTCVPILAVDWIPCHSLPIPTQPIMVFRLNLPLNQHLTELLFNLLSPEEQKRATRFRQLADQQRHMLGRGLFRLIAGQLTGHMARSVVIEKDVNGKPFLPQAPNWHLSVSHTGDWVVLAVDQVPVGVDVEQINPRFIIDDLIPTVLSQTEQQAMTLHPDSHSFFYELWTRKETLVKATGIGVTDEFVNIPALPGTHTVESRLIGGEGPWRVTSFFVDDTYPAALACTPAANDPSAQFYDISPECLSKWASVR
jgi:4'-phosphopantetheinyl transferase